MTKVNNAILSPDELVAALRNSSLPTLLVEGRSDMSVFQQLEEYCLSGSVDVLPAGSRDALFEVFRRRAEYPTARVGFLADADMFAFAPVPPELSGVIFTSGYSIENDVLTGGKALRLIGAKYKSKWLVVLDPLSHWFASIVHRYLEGEPVGYKLHPAQVFDFAACTLAPMHVGTLIDPSKLRNEARMVVKNPPQYLRGHTFLEALGHFLATAKHPSRCSKGILIQMDLVSWETNPALKRLIGEIGKALPGTIPSRPGA